MVRINPGLIEIGLIPPARHHAAGLVRREGNDLAIDRNRLVRPDRLGKDGGALGIAAVAQLLIPDGETPRGHVPVWTQYRRIVPAERVAKLRGRTDQNIDP